MRRRGARGGLEGRVRADDAARQILEMDDDEDEREFSKSIVYDFFTQADGTFQKMDKSLYGVFPPSLPRPIPPSQPTH